MTKYIVFLCWLGALPGLVAAGEIYRYVDEQGRVHYTDEPPPQYERKAEALTLDGVQTYEGRRLQTQPRAPRRESDDRGEVGYERVQLMRPASEQTIRDPSHTLTVSVQVAPPLRTKLGHRLQYFLDGQPAGAPTTSTSRTLTEVYRGTHTVQVVVVDGSGRQLAQTERRTVFMKPPSVN
ncbi:DUF4124 domain-containing protein [Abyssibacter profundi]|nr:DUF4124 domain-containing protein [Abyssibacter profundi]